MQSPATHHYGVRKVRASDGATFDDRDESYATPTTLKAATRNAAAELEPGYGGFWASAEVVDFNEAR